MACGFCYANHPPGTPHPDAGPPPPVIEFDIELVRRHGLQHKEPAIVFDSTGLPWKAQVVDDGNSIRLERIPLAHSREQWPEVIPAPRGVAASPAL